MHEQLVTYNQSLCVLLGTAQYIAQHHDQYYINVLCHYDKINTIQYNMETIYYNVLVLWNDFTLVLVILVTYLFKH